MQHTTTISYTTLHSTPLSGLLRFTLIQYHTTQCRMSNLVAAETRSVSMFNQPATWLISFQTALAEFLTTHRQCGNAVCVCMCKHDARLPERWRAGGAPSHRPGARSWCLHAADNNSLSLSIYIYIYICIHICMCIYIYIYIHRSLEL